MNKKIWGVIFIFICLNAFSQQNYLYFKNNSAKSKKTNPQPVRVYEDMGLKGIEIEYIFEGANVFQKTQNGIQYQTINIKDFATTEEVGKPALPCHTDIIAIPQNATLNIKIISYESKVYNNYLIYPALKLAVDKYGAPNPEFEIDKNFYSQDIDYPANLVDIVEIQKIRGSSLALVKIHPIQYNPKKKKLTVYANIKYKIEFTGGSKFIDSKQNSFHFLELYSNIMLNNKEIKNEITKASKKLQNTSKGNSKNYIIVTQDQYLQAADSLAKWKNQMGYSVEIISKPIWYSSQVKSEIANRYNSWTPKPDYVVFLGDHQNVPGQIITNSMGDDFATDLYYTCMDGGNDYYPDMARGRISVTTPTQAMMVIQKIINYERNPFNNNLFYKKGMNAAYFQDDDNNGYADRRFSLTSEDVLNYLTSQQSINVTRVYKTATTTNPLYWNNGTYANGEAVPNYLRKPTFPWTGNNTDINNAINNADGLLYVLHRDHGYEIGWGDPNYTNSDIDNLNNANRLPVVFSINCLTGKFLEAECFSEKFLRRPNGGTAGIFGHAEVSYSGYNDGLSIGLIDAIWANPGIIPNFTGNGDNPQGTPTAHSPIYTLGDVANQGLTRMVQTWGNNQYTFELLHYFGDPSMKIWTNNPISITASHPNTINCISDTSFTINNASCPDALASLVANGELIGSVQLVNGNGTIYFPHIYGNQAILTLSKHNYRPYTSNIIVNGGCVNAKFSVSAGRACVSDSIYVTDLSTGNILSYNWNFGADANPATSNNPQPLGIIYSTSGNKTINLTLTDINNNTYTFSNVLFIDPLCKYTIPATSTDSSNACSGILQDNGGMGEYSNNTNGFFRIRVPGAANITLNFNSFDFNASDDIIIYDGENTLSPSLGTFSGNSLPNGGNISSTSNVISIQQITNSTLTKPGFELSWLCNMPAAPIANFKISDTLTCKGEIKFTDISNNLPTNWLWDFGDGTTSNLQHPIHNYQLNGQYSVKLLITNLYGQDSVIKTNILKINRPNTPTFSGNTTNCGAINFSLTASGSGTINWYNSLTSIIPIDTGNIFNTGIISANTNLYIENQTFASSKYGGKSDNSGGGGYFNNTNIHFLMFNCNTPSILKSVKVYAASSGNRTINLRNSNGQIIATKTLMIQQGESRINLNFKIPQGNNFQLEAAANPNLYRNNAACNYPYQIGSSISITKSSATQSPTAFYYFFYDWEIQDEVCISSRIPIEIHVNTTVPNTDFSYNINNLTVNFNNLTTEANSYYWDFGDGNQSTTTNPTHTYANSGNYQVKLITTNICGNDSIIKPLALSLGIDNFNNQNILISPNPTKGSVFITIIKPEKYDRICIFNTSGQVVFDENFDNKNENMILQIDNLSKGIYYLHLYSNHQFITKKIVKL